jgi:2-oxoglutarate/2-oxoacid ferredoxin oxidoreductase subunit alpha
VRTVDWTRFAMMVGATPTKVQPRRRLLRGSEAIAEAMVVAGCRFFSGYPMTPFTEVLEEMAKKLPAVGGVCMNAESELEAVGMAWGAAATGTPAATGSTGQGLSLMQESLAEITLARLPLVVLNMARAQGDYWQATRGGGHGDYRHLVLAPVDVAEAVTLIQRAFHLAATWRNPVVLMGDYYLAHTARAVEVSPLDDLGPPPPTDWALTGETGGSGRAKLVSFLGSVKQREGVGYDLSVHYAACAEHTATMMREVPAEAETGCINDADVVVIAFGTPGAYVRAAVRSLREEGVPVGWVRPVTLVPFPSDTIASAARRAKAIAVFENNTGQMLDDVRLAVLGDAPVEFIGGLSLDAAGFGIAPDLDVAVVRRRILDVVERFR